LVLAGPGAGKTYCLIERVRYLVAEQAVPPERICTVTFTNKAADEVASRLAVALGSRAERVTRGTLHAVCADVLREHGTAIGIPRGFGVADEAYQRLLLRRLGVRNRRRVNDLLTLFARGRLQDATLSQRDRDLLTRYLAQLRRRTLLDFDDLISETARLFDTHADVAAATAARWDCVLVDEFQDLDPAQYGIIRTLAQGHRNIFAVGDDEQSIFSWRGADPRVLRRFADDFGIADPIVLEANRRCAKPIFEHARRLIRVDEGLFTKDLVAERESAFPVMAYTFPDERAETAFLLADLAADRAGDGLAWGDYAVLYRRHTTGGALEGAFIQAGIPCRLARGRALQDDEIAGVVIAALRLIRHPEDPLLAEQFAALVLPEELMDRVRRQARGSALEFLDAARAFARAEPHGSADAKKAWRLLYHVEGLTALGRQHRTLAGLVEDLLSQRLGKYTNALEDRHDELTDPAALPAAVALADRLAPVFHGKGRAVVARDRPDRVALRGLLLAGGVTLASYGGDATQDANAVVVDANPLTVFKALQLAHGRSLADAFADFVTFDLETTDLNVDTCEIIELGAVRVRDGVVVERFHSLVRPTGPVSEGARRTHGYADADLRDAPQFAEVWPRFRAFVGTDLLVAHNAFGFDLPVLRRVTAPLGGADNLVVYDSFVLARALFASGGALGALAERFGVTIGRAHHALDDAEALATIFRELVQLQLARARKSALVHLLDYVTLGLVLSDGPATDEAEVIRDVGRTYALGPYSDCLEFYEGERHRLAAADLPPLDVVIERLGGRRLMERLREQRSGEQRYPETYARLMQLVEASAAETLADSIDRLLERVALSTSEGVEADPRRVNLLTLHATKGLEFSRVYIVGVEDYELPGYYQTVEDRREEISEARRLLYVGMTRARDRLVLTRAMTRRGREAGGNRFLDDMGLVPQAAAAVTGNSRPVHGP
jgi:DNA polymerase III epsilon subunit family exonuclease